MSPPITFAFGPDNSWFFYCPGHIKHSNCSWAFKITVTKCLKKPYFISLGPGENEYCAFYERKDGQQWYSINYPSTSAIHPVQELFSSTISKNATLLHSAHCAVGYKKAFWACVLGKMVYAKQLPPGLEEAVRSRLMIEHSQATDVGYEQVINESKSVTPSQISFGINGEWFVRFKDGLCMWDLTPGNPSSEKSAHVKPSYPELRILLGSDKSPAASDGSRLKISYLVLDPYADRHWFCVLDSGSRVEFSLPLRTLKHIQPSLNSYLEGMQTVGGLQQEPQIYRNLSPKEQHGDNEKTSGSLQRTNLTYAKELQAEVPPGYQEESPTQQRDNSGNVGFWKRVTRVFQ